MLGARKSLETLESDSGPGDLARAPAWKLRKAHDSRALSKGSRPMRLLTVKSSPTISPTKPNRLKAALREACNWLTDRLGPHRSRLTKMQVATICSAIFVVAVGVR